MAYAYRGVSPSVIYTLPDHCLRTRPLSIRGNLTLSEHNLFVECLLCWTTALGVKISMANETNLICLLCLSIKYLIATW